MAREGQPIISLQRRQTPTRILWQRREELRPDLAPLPKAGFVVRVGRVAGDLTMLATGKWPLAEGGGSWPIGISGPPSGSGATARGLRITTYAGNQPPMPLFRNVEPLAWSLWVGVLRGDARQLFEEIAGPWVYDPDATPEHLSGLLSASAAFVFALIGALGQRAHHP